jgi:plastocyanin
MRRIAATLLLVVASSLAACGGGDDGATVTADADVQGSPQLRLEADPDGAPAYTSEEAVASEGNVAFVIENPTSESHTVAVEDEGGRVLGRTRIAINGSQTFTITMQAGTYTYFCTVPGHRKAGMEGTLTVEPG